MERGKEVEVRLEMTRRTRRKANTYLQSICHNQVPRIQPVSLLHRSGNRESVLPDADFGEQSRRFVEVGRVDDERIVGCWVERIEVRGTGAGVKDVDLHEGG